MNYVYLTNYIVTDIARVDPYTIFNAGYASGFIEAPDDVTFGWQLIDGEWFAPAPPTPDQIQYENKSKASQLLLDTDWTTIPDVADSTISNPYLINASEFASYRSQVRAIAVNPPTTPAVFPAKPNEQWSS